MFSTIKKNLVFFFLLGLAVATLAHPGSVEERDTVGLHAREAHAHKHFEDISLQSLDERGIEAATNEVLARSDGDLYKREIVKRDLGKMQIYTKKVSREGSFEKGQGTTGLTLRMSASIHIAPASAMRYAMLQRLSAAGMLQVAVAQSVGNRFMEETELRLSLVATTSFTQLVLGNGFKATTAALFAGGQYIRVAA